LFRRIEISSPAELVVWKREKSRPKSFDFIQSVRIKIRFRSDT
jgi:hypothetical protein